MGVFTDFLVELDIVKTKISIVKHYRLNNGLFENMDDIKYGEP